MTKLIILRGYPGAGKTTIGKQLAKEHVGTLIDHNAILTFIADIAGDDDGIYDDIANLELAITRKLLKDQTNVIVARGFGTLESLQAYEDLASELGVEPVIIRLDVGTNILIQRVSSSERLNDFNPTVTKEALDEWLASNPLIDHPSEKNIDNTQPVAEVIKVIAAIVQST